jgi:hypothetical protein
MKVRGKCRSCNSSPAGKVISQFVSWNPSTILPIGIFGLNEFGQYWRCCVEVCDGQFHLLWPWLWVGSQSDYGPPFLTGRGIRVLENMILTKLESTLGFSACEAMAGNITILNNSCLEWKSCYQSAGTISIKNRSCQAHSCSEMREMNTTVTINNQACVGWKVCQKLKEGEVIQAVV